MPESCGISGRSTNPLQWLDPAWDHRCDPLMRRNLLLWKVYTMNALHTGTRDQLAPFLYEQLSGISRSFQDSIVVAILGELASVNTPLTEAKDRHLGRDLIAPDVHYAIHDSELSALAEVTAVATALAGGL